MSQKRNWRRFNYDMAKYGSEQKLTVQIGKYNVKCDASRNSDSGTWRGYVTQDPEVDFSSQVDWDKWAECDPFEGFIHGGITCTFGDRWGMDFHHGELNDWSPFEPYTHKKDAHYWNFHDAKIEIYKIVWVLYKGYVSSEELTAFEKKYLPLMARLRDLRV